MESVPYTIRALDSIREQTHLSQDKFFDQEFGNFLCRRITEEIHLAGLLLNGLLNDFEVTFPTKKTGTVNILIEEVLRENQVRLKEKEVRIFKKLEKDLPEIVVPEKPLRYILNSIL